MLCELRCAEKRHASADSWLYAFHDEVYMNNHYVTKRVISEWSSLGNNLVYYYSHSDQTLKRDFPVNMYSVKDFLTLDDERYYSEIFETGLGRFIKSHTNTNFCSIRDRSVERSVRLYFYFQIERLNKLYEKRKSEISLLSDKELNQFLSVDMNNFILIGLNLEHGFVVLPEVGFFPLIAIDECTKKSVVLICCPLTPHFILVKQSKKYEINYAKILKSDILSFSYGTAIKYDSVIIPY